LTKDLADAKERERKEREAKERLEKAQADKDRQLAAGKQQLAEKDKQLGEANQRERKEREAKERLDKDRQVAETREKERHAHEAQEIAAREKLADGPDMPSRIPEEVHCPQLDDARAGADLFIHCAVQPGVKAKEVVFYYRPAGVAQYNALVLARSRKGWLTAMIPASRLVGKSLQYYVEARGAASEVAAAIGKAGSPNIMTLAPPAGPPPTVAESRAYDAALATVAPVAGRAPPGRARAPAKRGKARGK
jgi:hypothetical protein